MKKDPNAWTAGVELQQIRDRIIFHLLDLKDFDYQNREWLKDGFDTEFDHNILSSVELILEDLLLEQDIISGAVPIRLIDQSLKSEEEAIALYKVAEVLDKLMQDAYRGHDPWDYCAKNEEYLSSPYLSKLHQASQEAFEIFMENEKDNKEFCTFIEDLKKKEGRS